MAVGTVFAGTNMAYINCMQMSPNGDKVYVTSENFHNVRSLLTMNEFDAGFDSQTNIAGSPSLSTGNCNPLGSAIAAGACKGDAEGIGTNAKFNTIYGLAIQFKPSSRTDVNLFIADTYNNKIKRVNLSTFKVTTFDRGVEKAILRR